MKKKREAMENLDRMYKKWNDLVNYEGEWLEGR